MGGLGLGLGRVCAQQHRCNDDDMMGVGVQTPAVLVLGLMTSVYSFAFGVVLWPRDSNVGWGRRIRFGRTYREGIWHRVF